MTEQPKPFKKKKKRNFPTKGSKTQPGTLTRIKASGSCNLDPRNSIFHQTVNRVTVANHIFLASWMVDIHQECHSLRSAPQGRHTALLRWCFHSIPGKQSGQNWGGD